MLNFGILRRINVARCVDVFTSSLSWSTSDWGVAFAGEAGEVCDAIKKLNRLEGGTNTAKDPQSREEAIRKIGDEIADTIIYADLLAHHLGIDLEEAVIRKFNAVSDRMGSEIKL